MAIASAQTLTNLFNDPRPAGEVGLSDLPDTRSTRCHAAGGRGSRARPLSARVSLWLDGRCRLHNAYLHDAEIVPHAQLALRVDGRFGDTSLWVAGQRRWVWLQGCVRTAEQADAAERQVLRLDDVEGVVN